MKIRCAICDRETTLDASNDWRPFCSERCKLLDLSSWLDGEYVIPGRPTDGEPLPASPDATGSTRDPHGQ